MLTVRRNAFSLIELLVVIGIVAVLLGILMPALGKARKASRQTVCASNLRQVGAAIAMYVGENEQRLPLVVEPFWKPDGTYDYTADPTDPLASPQSFHVLLRRYLSNMKVLLCPAANVGYPNIEPVVSYRISSANNFDGRTLLYEQLFSAIDGSPNYNFNLKFLNGRKYKLVYADEYRIPRVLKKGVGPYYLLRDLVTTDVNGTPATPHPNRQFNQLKMDFSVSLEKDPGFALTVP